MRATSLLPKRERRTGTSFQEKRGWPTPFLLDSVSDSYWCIGALMLTLVHSLSLFLSLYIYIEREEREVI